MECLFFPPVALAVFTRGVRPSKVG